MNINRMALAIIATLTLVIAMISTTTTLPQSANAFSWPHLDRSSGKAPIAVSDNNVYVTWWGNNSGNYEVMFKASNDSGQTFGDNINLSNSTKGISVDADIAASGNNVYILFADNRSGFADAYIMTSNDNGKAFNPAVILTDNINSTITNKTIISQMNSYKVKTPPYELKVAAAGNNVYALATGAEKNSTTYQPDVFLRVSNDSGRTFGNDINLSLSDGITSDRIQIKAIDSNVYVTWWDKNLDGTDTPLMRISNDGGQTFGEPMILTANSTSSS
jgi:hypothetical protein